MIEEDKNRLTLTPSPGLALQDIDRAERAAAADQQESASFFEFASASLEEDQILSYMLEDKEEFAPDDGWADALNEDLYKELTADIPEEYHDYLEDTVSLGHARATREYVMQSLKNEEKMASWGWSGVPMRIALNIADPVAIGATVATEGVAAPLIWGGKATRLARIVRGAVAGAATNAAIEGYIASQSETRDEYDVLYSATAGLLLGGGIGAIPFGKRTKDQDPTIQAHENHLDAITQAQEQDAAAAAKAFLTGDTSVGAATNPLSPSPVIKPLSKGVDNLDDDILTQETMWGIARIDMVGRLLQSKNPVFNRLGQILGEDAVGVRDGGKARIESTADILKTNIMKGTFARFYQTYNQEYSDWVKSSTKGILRKYRLTNRRAFGELVADAIERPDLPHHPAVKRMAQKNAELYADLLDQAQRAGVKGFETIPKNLTYFTHRWNKFKIQEMYQKYGDDAVHGLLRQGLINGSTDLSDDAADQIARVMLDKIRSDVAGVDSGFSRLFTADSRETLKQIMLEEKFGKINKQTGRYEEFSEADVDNLLGLFEQTERGVPARAKARLRFDMETEIEFGGQTLSLKELQDRDAEQVFTMYASEMAGRIALAKKGIKSETDFNKMINEGRKYAEANTISRGATDKESEISQVMYNLLLGRRPSPQYDPNATYMKITRLVQDYNFLRLMGQVGWAQFAEIGNAYNVNGFKGMLQVMPEYRSMLNRARDGKLSDPVLRDIEAFYGTGSDRMIQQMINRLDYMETGAVIGGGKLGRALGKAQLRTDQLKRLQADVSGMAPITLMLERGTARVVAQTLSDLAYENASLSLKRLNSLGLDDDTAKLVFKNIKEHAKVQSSALFRNKKLRELNLENWDPDAREAFGVALARWTRRTIQQNDVGNLSLFMTKPWGQVITQFRTFQIVSHSKQLMHNLQMNDARAYLAMTFSAMTAGAAYFAQQNVKMIGMNDRERKKYAEENLSIGNVARAGFSRSSWSAFIPGTLEHIAYFVSDEPLFSYRTTGLSQNFLSGVPTVQAFNQLYHGAARATRTTSPFSNEEMTEGRARALLTLLPFQNVTGIANVHRYFAEQFPERSGR